MKKLWLFAFAIISVLGIALSGCSGGNVKLSQENVILSVNEEMELSDIFDCENILFSKVSFKSSNPEVAFVTPNLKLAGISVGTAIISATYGIINVYVDVTVVSEQVSFTAPQSIYFDKASNSVKWETVYLQRGEGASRENVNASSYTVWAKREGNINPTETVLFTNEYKLDMAGVYELRVKTNAQTNIGGSDYNVAEGDGIKVTVFPAATGVNYVDSYFDVETSHAISQVGKGTLTWQGISGYKYKVNINDVLTSEISVNEMGNATYIMDTDNSAKPYIVSVITVANSENASSDDNVVFAETNEIMLKRLSAPANFSVREGELTWQDTQQGVDNYEIYIDGIDTETVNLSASFKNYSMPNIEGGSGYSVSLRAVAPSQPTSGIQYLSQTDQSVSAYTTISSITKLNSFSITYEPSTKTVKCEDIDNSAEYPIAIEIRKGEELVKSVELNESNSFTYIWDISNNGIYKVFAKTLAQSETEINSDVVDSNFTITKLSGFGGINIKEENNKVEFSFAPIENATTYQFYGPYSENPPESASTIDYSGTGNVSCQIDSSAFSSAGQYYILLVAGSPQEGNKYCIAENSTIDLTRLQNVVPTFNNEDQSLTWQNIANQNGYEYYVTDSLGNYKIVNNKAISFDHGEEVGLNISALNITTPGTYKFFVKARGHQNVLSSYSFESVVFDIKHQLSPCQVDFSQTDGLKLIITNIDEYAKRVAISINNGANLYADFYNENSLSVDISSHITGAGNYNISVKSLYSNVGGDALNGLIIDSVIKNINIVKQSAPSSINLTRTENLFIEGETLSIDNPNNYAVDIKVNGETFQEGNRITASEDIIIEAHFVAKESSGNTYYIQSDTSTFTARRLSVPRSFRLDFDTQSYVWEAIAPIPTDSYEYVLVVQQGGTISEAIFMESQTSISALSLIERVNQKNAQFNSLQNFSIQVLGWISTKEIICETESYITTAIASNGTESIKLTKPNNLHFESGKVTWPQVNGAEHYEVSVQFDEEMPQVINVNQPVDENAFVEFNYTSGYDSVGIYKIKVIACAQDSVSSDISDEITVEKLPVLDSVTINRDELLNVVGNVDISKLSVSAPYSISINESEVSTNGNLNLSSYDDEFTVNIIQKAKQWESGDRCFYIDSNASNFVFSRLSQVVWKMEELEYNGVANADKYELLFTKGETVLTKKVSNAITVVSLTDADVLDFLDSVGSGEFTVSVRALKDFVTEVYLNKNEALNLSSKSASLPQSVVWVNPIENLSFDEGIVKWNKVENADTYSLSIQYNEGLPVIAEISQPAEAEVVEYTESSFYNVGSYKIIVTAKSNNVCIESKSEIIVEKLPAMQSVVISKNEIMSVVQNVDRQKLDNLNPWALLVDEESKDLTNGELDLSEYNGTFNIKIVQNAKQSQIGDKLFYITSQPAAFTFTRLQTIEWKDATSLEFNTISHADKYEIYFDRDGRHFSKIVDATIDKVYLTDPEVVNFLNIVGSGDFITNVRALRNLGESTTLNSGNTLLLSSKTASENRTITFLNAPISLAASITAGDKIQKNITINWEHTNVGTGNITAYDLFVNGELEKTIENATTDFENKQTTLIDAFAEAGDYEISLVARGIGCVISSDQSENLKLTRLPAPTHLSLNKSGVFSWANNTNATSSIVDFIDNQYEGTSTSKDLFDLIGESTGEFISKVCYVGNGSRYLSSEYAELSWTRLCLTSLTPSNDRISAESNNSDLTIEIDVYHKADTTANADITDFTGYTIINRYSIANNSYLLYSQDWPVGRYLFVACAVSTQEKDFVTSPYMYATAVKLQTPIIVGYARNAGENDTLVAFKADVNNSIDYATRYVLREGVNQTSISASLITDETFVYNFTNEVLQQTAENFTIRLIAFGGVKDSEMYMNSSELVSDGKKNSAVSGFAINDGQIIWDTQSLANSFLLKYNEDYKVLDAETQKDRLQDIETETSFVLTIKAKGNITTETQTDNVVLDSVWSDNLSAVKLGIPTEYCVSNGYISVKEQTTATSYNVKSAQMTFRSPIIVDAPAGYTRLYFNELYENMTRSDDFELSIQAISDQANVIYSEFSTPLTMNILTNDNDSETIIVEKYRISEQPLYDLSLSHIKWNTTAQTGASSFVAKVGSATNILVDNDDAQLSHSQIVELLEDTDAPYGSTTSFDFTLYVQGSSEAIAGVNYLSSDKAIKTFNVLEKPLYITLSEGFIVWSAVENATGYYLLYKQADSYLWTLYANTEITGERQIDFSNIFDQTDANYHFKVLAVDNTGSYLPSTETLFVDSEENLIDVTRLGYPTQFSYENGAMFWDQTEIVSGDIISGFTIAGAQPFTRTESNILDQILQLEFTSNSGVKHYANIYAVAFIKMEEILFSVLRNNFLNGGFGSVFSTLDGFDANELHGWPSNLPDFDTLADEITYGAYKLRVRQLGNTYDESDIDNSYYINSEFNSMNSDIYVPKSPTINISINADGEYIMSWNAIALPEFSAGSPRATSYKVLAERMENNFTYVDEIAIIENTNINLSTLINDGILTSNHTKIYVVVAGDTEKDSTADEFVVNGIASNKIKTTILETVRNVKLQDGQYVFSGQTGVSEYLITATPNESGETVEVRLNGNATGWDSSSDGLEANKSYQITIQQIGTALSKNAEIVVSGPVLNVGSVTKLDYLVAESEGHSQVMVVNGVFVWEEVANATKYRVYYKSGLELAQANLNDFGGDFRDSVINSFEPYMFAGEGQYSFRAIGTTNDVMTSETTGYISSQFSVLLNTNQPEAISGIETREGVLYWTGSGGSGNRYKLIFTDIGDIGTGGEYTFVLQDLASVQNKVSFAYSNIYEELSTGHYSLTIQSYIKGEQETNYQLISMKQDSNIELTKMAEPTDLNVENALVQWKGGLNDYNLTFTSTSTHGSVSYDTRQLDLNNIPNNSAFQYNSVDGIWSFDSCIQPELTEASQWNLSIQAISRQTLEMPSSSGQINSNKKGYTNISTMDLLRITQIAAIDKNQIVLSADTQTGIMVQIEMPNVNITLEVDAAYYIGDATGLNINDDYTVQRSIAKVHIDSENNIGIATFAIRDLENYNGSGIINLCLRVSVDADNTDATLTRYNAVKSAWGKSFTISSLESVKDMNYETQSQQLVFTYGQSDNSSIAFVVTDEYLSSGGDGQWHTVSSVILFNEENANGDFEYAYQPYHIGTHKFTVTVMHQAIIGQDTETTSIELISGQVSLLEGSDPKEVEFDLFESGSGKNDDPYIITNVAQFNNINKRLSKYLITDYLGFGYGSANHHFKLNNNISVDNDSRIVNTSNQGFEGVFDGNQKTITLTDSVAQLSKLGKNPQGLSQDIGALFENITAGAEVKNFTIAISNLTYEGSEELQFALVVGTNRGTVSNVQTNTAKITINRNTTASSSNGKSFFISGIVYNNYGTIQRCINNVSFEINRIFTGGEIGSSSVKIGGIANLNGSTSGIIRECGNNGSIILTGLQGATVGGLIAKNDGEVSNSYSKGAVTITAQEGDNINGIYIGGLVGHNTGTISDSYVVGQFISSGSQSINIKFAGFIGYTESYRIQRTFVKLNDGSTAIANADSVKFSLFANAKNGLEGGDKNYVVSSPTENTAVSGANVNLHVTKVTNVGLNDLALDITNNAFVESEGVIMLSWE